MFIRNYLRFFTMLAAVGGFLCAAHRGIARPQDVAFNTVNLSSTNIGKINITDVKFSGIAIGEVRVQFISDSLVRLELKGPEGFEDRNTFHVVDRSGPTPDWAGLGFDETNGVVDLKTTGYIVRVPMHLVSTADSKAIPHFTDPVSLDGVSVLSTNGDVLYRYDGHLENNHW